MGMINGYEHKIASHCESGSIRNLLHHAKFKITEPMAFGIGSGITFAYLFFAKGAGGMPVTGLRLPMGTVINNVADRIGINIFRKKFKSTNEAMQLANEKIDQGIPVTLSVDMFYMKYLPVIMQIHIPFHFIVLVGRDDTHYYVSDPYFQGIGKITKEELRLAWDTNSLLAKDNFLAYVVDTPKEVDWKKPILKSINATCNNELLGPVVRQILPIFGYEGIKFFAKEMLKWPEKYRANKLREGMLYTPIIFEEQGTGGGAFRLMYGAFLIEASDKLNSAALKEKAFEMVENGNQWREASREIVKVAKDIPVSSFSAYDEWYAKNKSKLNDGIRKCSQLFVDRANEEKKIFTDIKKILKTIK